MGRAESFSDIHSAGFATARVRTAASPAEAARRAATARAARANLAAAACEEFGGVEAVKADPALRQRAADRFAELLDFLGLNVLPEHQPGHCRNPECRRVMPMLAASTTGHPSRSWWRAGYCSAKCWSAA